KSVTQLTFQQLNCACHARTPSSCDTSDAFVCMLRDWPLSHMELVSLVTEGMTMAERIRTWDGIPGCSRRARNFLISWTRRTSGVCHTRVASRPGSRVHC